MKRGQKTQHLKKAFLFTYFAFMTIILSLSVLGVKLDVSKLNIFSHTRDVEMVNSPEHTQEELVFQPFDVERYRKEHGTADQASEAEVISESDDLADSENSVSQNDRDARKKFIIGGWIPQWDFNSGLFAVQNHEAFNEVSPVWYHLNNDGSLIINRPARYVDLMELRLTGDLKVIPTVACFDADIMHSVLSSDVNRDRQIDEIMYEVTTYDYDGIDLDYEQIYDKDKVAFFEFLTLLSDRLHDENKILSVTVLPKWGDKIIYSSSPQTRSVQDWGRIAQLADEVRIMAYDFTVTSDPEAGPITPKEWLKKIIDYAKEEIPEDKIIVGLPLYAYEWGSDGRRNVYTYGELQGVLGADIENNYHTALGESMAIYKCADSVQCTVYYQSKEALGDKVDIVKKSGVAGVYFWRLGGEGDLFTGLL